MPCETGTDWSDASVSQKMPSIASNQQKLGERHRTDSTPDLPIRNQPVDILIVHSNDRINLCYFKVPILWQFVTAALGN